MSSPSAPIHRKIAILDNFCWPSVDDEQDDGHAGRGVRGVLRRGQAYGIPFITGKDSLHNQFTNQETGEVIRIPNTLLISAIGVIEDVRKCVTMDLKARAEGHLCLASPKSDRPEIAAGQSHREMSQSTISHEHVMSCHDIQRRRGARGRGGDVHRVGIRAFAQSRSAT